MSTFLDEDRWMHQKYTLCSKIGEGGFGKVYWAIHQETGEKVAMKIMDKEKLGDDLPHVYREIESMKVLSHQNICRLLQVVETKRSIYLVLEYCDGGEMFDYIVTKNRLEESEARHFFRQLVQAMDFTHNQGFAHRDLKPENLLIKSDYQLKVIDFGLSARTGRLLSTYCGSLCYAAPEILSNRPYDGKISDIWSMGVLLYILVCGSSPFNMDCQRQVYQSITSGNYKLPSYLSDDCRDLLRRMMTVDTERRIKMADVINHPWIKSSYQLLKTSSIYPKNFIDDDVLTELAGFHNLSKKSIGETLRKWKYDYTTATYLLLLLRKEQRRPVTLPDYNRRPYPNVVNSPTFHASLETNLQLLGTERGATGKPVFDSTGICRTPVNQRNMANNKENIPATAHYPPVNRGYEQTPRREIHVRPRDVRRRTGSLPRGSVAPPSRPPSTPTSNCSQNTIPITPTSPCSQSSTPRKPRPTVKTPQVARRLFASLERKKERAFEMITPRRYRSSNVKICKGFNFVNVSMTACDKPEPIRDQLIEILKSMNYTVRVDGFRVAGVDAVNKMEIELEVIQIEKLNKIGIRRKRIKGEAAQYKKVCEEVLKMADFKGE